MALLRVLRSFLNGSGRNMLSVKAFAVRRGYKSRERRGRVFPVPRCGQERGERFRFGHIVSKNMRRWRTGLLREISGKPLWARFQKPSALNVQCLPDIEPSGWLTVSDTSASLKVFWTSPWALGLISHSCLLSHCLIVVMKRATDKIHDTRAERIPAWSAHKTTKPNFTSAKCTEYDPCE